MEKTFVIQFSEEDLQLVNQALIQIPYKYSAPLIQKINLQIQRQVTNAEELNDAAKKYG